jgi:hypothetical protein
LSAVLSDILGFSGKRILQALCAGENDPMRLARAPVKKCCAGKSMRCKPGINALIKGVEAGIRRR